MTNNTGLRNTASGEAISALYQARLAEHQKYKKVYQMPAAKYSMSDRRREDAVRDLTALPCRGRLLDVSCGRGEMLNAAEDIGFDIAIGTEIVPELIKNDTRVYFSEAHNLQFPSKSYDVVTLWDVIEHLIPGDDELACKELLRVARKYILLTANNRPSKSLGVELHINRRPYREWDDLFNKWFSGCKVEWLQAERQHVSECWKITIPYDN